MEKELLKLVAQVSLCAIVAFIVSSALDKKDTALEKRAAAQPVGREWVTGIVDGPLAQSSAYVPASTMGV